jgi:hypothetical protein
MVLFECSILYFVLISDFILLTARIMGRTG